MTSDELKQSITAWCTSDDNLSFAGESSDPGAEFALSVTAIGPGGAPVSMDVLKGSGADRITIQHTATLAAGAASAASQLVETRPGWVTAVPDRMGGGMTVQAFVYLDGLSKNSFVHATSEVARTARLLANLSTAGAVASTVPSGQPATATPATAPQPLPAPTFSPAPTPQATPSYTPAWAPTHSVPPQGMRAWAAPDPAGPVVANLAPGLPIQVTEVRGAWARVVCSNGWTGWIDGRIIGVAA